MSNKEKKKKLPFWGRKLLKYTEYEAWPTDPNLDAMVQRARYILHAEWPEIKKIFWKKIWRFFRYGWKNLIKKIFLIVVFAIVSYIAVSKVVNVRVEYYTQTKVDTCLHYKSDSTMTLRNFLVQIAYNESRYNKDANRDGSQFWGLYQIGADARTTAGYADIPKDVFLAHPEIQDLCMIELLKYNKKDMQSYINKYSGKIIDGVLVTESGILALAQLGCGAAKGYLSSGRIPAEDEFGNSPRTLLKLGGYQLNLNDVKYSIQDAVHK